jgi:hypothetical protein
MKVRWECQCGKSGWMTPKNTSMAGMVRQARSEHECPNPDIERLESREEYERRMYNSHIIPGVF